MNALKAVLTFFFLDGNGPIHRELGFVFPLLGHCHVYYFDGFSQIKELLLIFVSICYTLAMGSKAQ